MRRNIFLAAPLGLACVLLWAASPTLAGEKDFVPGQAIVVLQPGGSIDAVNAQYDTEIIDVIPRQGGDLYLLALPSNLQTRKQVRRLQRDSGVFTAVPNRIVRRNVPLSFPNDDAEPGAAPDAYHGQPFVTQLQITRAQEMSRGEGAVVAIVDTGIDFTHPAFEGKLWRNEVEWTGLPGVDDDANGHVDDVTGYDTYDYDSDASEEAFSDPTISNIAFGHGTFIAGLVLRVAPSARIMPIRAFNSAGVGTAWCIAKAVEYAVTMKADIVNMSFGSPQEIESLDEVMKDSEGVVFIAAVGNGNQDRPEYPAIESDVIGVTAVNDRDVKAVFSNLGKSKDLAAPGVRLVSTYPGNAYATWSGTSFAAPLVAATAALRIAKVRNTTLGGSTLTRKDIAEDAIRALEDTALNIRDDKLGRGRVDPVPALNAPIHGGSGDGGGDGDTNLDERIDLTANAGGSASGRARRRVDGSRQRFDVEVEDITGGAVFTLLVRTATGSFTDTFTVETGGRREIDYDTQSDEESATPLPPELDPVRDITAVEIRDASGTLVLSGDF